MHSKPQQKHNGHAMSISLLHTGLRNFSAEHAYLVDEHKKHLHGRTKGSLQHQLLLLHTPGQTHLLTWSYTDCTRGLPC